MGTRSMARKRGRRRSKLVGVKSYSPLGQQTDKEDKLTGYSVQCSAAHCVVLANSIISSKHKDKKRPK